MDNRGTGAFYSFQDRLVDPPDESEFAFEPFITADTRPSTGGFSSPQYGPNENVLGQRSAPWTIARPQAAPTSFQGFTAVGSFGSPSVVSPSIGPALSFSSSPPQNFDGFTEWQSFNTSPMARSRGYTDNFFPELSGTAESIGSWDEGSVSLAYASAPSAMEGTGSQDSHLMGDDIDFHGRLTEEQLSSILNEVNFASQISPRLLPESNYPNSLQSEFSLPPSNYSPDCSPVLVPQDGGMMADFVMLGESGSAEASPELMPQDSSRRRRGATRRHTGSVPMDVTHSRGGSVPNRNNSLTKGGRNGPLPTQIRLKAAKMRQMRACDNCRRRKASCDQGLYCGSCIRYYGKRLTTDSCCRGRVLSTLTKGLLNDSAFPACISLDSFLGPGYKRTAQEFQVLLHIGFGPPVPIMVRAVVLPGRATERLHHDHILYQWPLQPNQATQKRICTHKVFPGVLSSVQGIRTLLDEHLTNLVDNHFEDFPDFRSPLVVLPHIYKYYKTLPDCEPRRILHEAFKLLLLSHIGGDFYLSPDRTARRIVDEFFKTQVGSDCTGGFKASPSLGEFPTPCFIRSQFGQVMPQLAAELLTDILRRLEPMCLDRKCDMWANAFATTAILLMATESIDYHVGQGPFHANQDGVAHPDRHRVWSASPAARELAADTLLDFYSLCFQNCHGRLSDASGRRKRSNSGTAATAASGSERDAQAVLVAGLKTALGNAQTYVLEKAGDVREAVGDDMSYYFDRRLARLFTIGLQLGS